MTTHNHPIVSIITVVFNGAKTLRATMDSIVPHLSDEVEYIVIDGGSTDGTQDIIAEYAGHLAYWVSERDRGIYDAMNKGKEMASGRFLLHINVGDRLIHIPTSILASIPNNVVCVAGRVHRTKTGTFSPSNGFSLNYHNTLHHQGCFYSKQHSPDYDTTYRVFADFDVNQKISSDYRKIAIINEVIASHEEDGISNNPRYFREVYEIVKKNRGWIWLTACWLHFKWQGLKAKTRSYAK